MGYATKFRLITCLSGKQIMQQFTYDIYLFIYKVSVYYNHGRIITWTQHIDFLTLVGMAQA